MHELAVTQSIISTVIAAAQRAEARRVTAIDLELGVFCGYVPDSIQFYFDHISKGTLAEGAAIRIHRVAARCHCTDCGSDFMQEEENLFVQCPTCGSVRFQVEGGREFLVESIEVEDK